MNTGNQRSYHQFNRIANIVVPHLLFTVAVLGFVLNSAPMAIGGFLGGWLGMTTYMIDAQRSKK